MSTHTSVLWTTDQGLTTEQKAQARRNIDAASSEDVLASKTEVVQGTGVNVSEATGANGQKIYTISNAYEAPVQSDWSESDSSKQDYIKNKPSNIVQDASYVHTDNNFTNALKDKLDGIEAGAEANVQSDWNQNDSSADDYIKNKPNLQRVVYGSTASELTGLKFDADDPEGYVHILLDSEQQATGQLVAGPYKTLLDSGTAGSKGDEDHGIYIDSNGVFQECTNAVLFKCTLSTTFAELEAAISAGKVPFLVTASRVIPMCRYTPKGSAWFTDVTMLGNLFTIGAHSYTLTPSGWSEYPKSMNNNEDIHIPSCITAKATVAVQDDYAEWIRIGKLIIGGRGNSSGSISIGVKSSVSGSNTFLTDSTFRTKNTNSNGSADNSFEASSVTVSNAQWNILRTIDQYSGTATVNCSYDINMFDTSSNSPSCYNIKIHKLYDDQYSRLYISATESWGSMT